MLSEIIAWLKTPSPLQTAIIAAGIMAVACVTIFARSIRRRLKKLDSSTFFGNAKDPFRLIRDPSLADADDPNRHMSVVDLNPEFVKKHQDKCKMMSLGQYLQSLRPSIVTDELPQWLEGELQAALALGLVRALGPTMGAALLPGTGFFDSMTARIARLAMSIWMGSGESRVENESIPDALVDHSGLPLTLYNIIYLTEMNYERSRINGGDKGPTPWQVLCRGEVFSNPSFGGTLPQEESEKNPPQPDLVPNPFDFALDWHRTIEKMENKLKEMGPYDPDSKTLSPSLPIDERLFPDLHLGYGDAPSTHTQREILMNRLLSVLLNRLSTNCLVDMKKEEFVIVLEGGEEVRKAEDLVKAIIDMGHDVEVAATSHVTTFGLGLCLKEKDGSFTEIPLAAMVENGYTDKKDRKSYTALTHGGLNMDIKSGPLLKGVSIQHFIAIEGLCAWASNNNVDVPWVKDVDCGRRLKGYNAIPAVRLASIQALIVSTVGSDLNLPNGGYGLTGVCNDTAAWLEQSLFGSTHVYPITLTGRFAMHMLRRARELEAKFNAKKEFAAEAKATRELMAALTKLPSDMTNLPSGVVEQCRRQLHCMHPERPFKLMQKTESIIKNVQEEIAEASSAAKQTNGSA